MVYDYQLINQAHPTIRQTTLQVKLNTCHPNHLSPTTTNTIKDHDGHQHQVEPRLPNLNHVYNSFKLRIYQHFMIPFHPPHLNNSFLKNYQFIYPENRIIQLKISIKVNNSFLTYQSFLGGSLFENILIQLELIANDNMNCIEEIGVTRVDPKIPNACFIDLKVTRLDESLEELLQDQKLVAQLSSMDLSFEFGLDKTNQEIHKKKMTETVKLDLNDRLIHIQKPEEKNDNKISHDFSHPATSDLYPSTIPEIISQHSDIVFHPILIHPLPHSLHSSLKNLFFRFHQQILSIQLPLIFNSDWRKLLHGSVSIQTSISNILTRFFEKKLISNELKLELKNLSKPLECMTRIGTEEELNETGRISREIRKRLFELQLKMCKVPRISNRRDVTYSRARAQNHNGLSSSNIDDLNHSHDSLISMLDLDSNHENFNLTSSSPSDSFEDLSCINSEDGQFNPLINNSRIADNAYVDIDDHNPSDDSSSLSFNDHDDEILSA